MKNQVSFYVINLDGDEVAHYINPKVFRLLEVSDTLLFHIVPNNEGEKESFYPLCSYSVVIA